MYVITTLRLAKTPPKPEHVRADCDCIWDSDDFVVDEEGFCKAEYSPQGSYPESFWESQSRAILLGEY